MLKPIAIALSEIAATTLLIIQLLSSVLFLTAACYLSDRHLPFSWKHLKQGFAGIFEPALAYMVGIFGVERTTASSATLIGSSEVILTILCAALCAVVFLGERLTRTKLLLAGISFSALLLLIVNDAKSANHSSLVGDFLVLLGTIFAVVYVLCSQKQIETANPLHLTSSQQLVGLITTVFCFSVLSMINPIYEVRVAGISSQFLLLAIGSGIMEISDKKSTTHRLAVGWAKPSVPISPKDLRWARLALPILHGYFVFWKSPMQYALAFLLCLIALRTIPVSHLSQQFKQFL